MGVKHLFIALPLTFLSLSTVAQTSSSDAVESENVLPLPYEEAVSKSQAQQNADYWRDQVTNNGQDKNAMFNLVIANRQLGAANFYLYNNAEIVNIADSLTVLAPNSFEAQYANYLTEYPSDDAFKSLESAANVAPNEQMLTGPLMEKALVENDLTTANTKAKELSRSGQLDPGLVAVAKDVSVSSKSNSIIFCEGEMDCYPLYSQQAVAGKPTANSIIVDRQLLSNSRYRNNVWDRTVGSGEPPTQANATIKGICERSPMTSYLTLSIDRSLINSLQADLYVIGNVFQYSPAPMKNIPLLEKNWKAMDGQSVASPLNSNYLVPAITLKNHYSETGQEKKADQMEEEIVRIAERNGKKQQLQNAGFIKN